MGPGTVSLYPLRGGVARLQRRRASRLGARRFARRGFGAARAARRFPRTGWSTSPTRRLREWAPRRRARSCGGAPASGPCPRAIAPTSSPSGGRSVRSARCSCPCASRLIISGTWPPAPVKRANSFCKPRRRHQRLADQDPHHGKLLVAHAVQVPVQALDLLAQVAVTADGGARGRRATWDRPARAPPGTGRPWSGSSR